MAAYWEIPAHSAYDVVSYHEYLIVNLYSFFRLRLSEWEFLSHCAISSLLPTVIFIPFKSLCIVYSVLRLTYFV